MLCDERFNRCNTSQHFAVIGDTDTWRERGWNHPKRYPIEKGFIQVHHFKWDSTILERLKEVSETKEDYSYWKEYKKCIEAIQLNDWKIDVKKDEFLFVNVKKIRIFVILLGMNFTDVIVKNLNER